MTERFILEPGMRIEARGDDGVARVLLGLDSGENPATFLCTAGTLAFCTAGGNTVASLATNGGESGNVVLMQGGHSTIAESMHHMRGIRPRTTYDGTEDDGHKWSCGEAYGAFQIYNATTGNRALKIHPNCQRYEFHANGWVIQWGHGSPEGIVVAPTGSLYLNFGGGAGRTLWIKESGAESTGWIAK